MSETNKDSVVIVSAACTPMAGFQGDFASQLGAVAVAIAAAGAASRACASAAARRPRWASNCCSPRNLR